MNLKEAAKCVYGQYCSFAHTEDELKIKLLHKKVKNPEFYKYLYKTVYCPFNHQHDKSSCEYAHNVQDFRRDPSRYSAEVCKKWDMSSDINKYSQGGCSLKEKCDKCHGWKELEYHPKYFKTKQCSNGDGCPRADCGYLHQSETPKKKPLKKGSKVHHESVKELMTGASQSHQSSSKNEKILTFQSSSISKKVPNDSVMGRNFDEDQIDIHSIADLEQNSHKQARTEVDEDDESVEGRTDSPRHQPQTQACEEVLGRDGDRRDRREVLPARRGQPEERVVEDLHDVPEDVQHHDLGEHQPPLSRHAQSEHELADSVQPAGRGQHDGGDAGEGRDTEQV